MNQCHAVTCGRSCYEVTNRGRSCYEVTNRNQRCFGRKSIIIRSSLMTIFVSIMIAISISFVESSPLPFRSSSLLSARTISSRQMTRCTNVSVTNMLQRKATNILQRTYHTKKTGFYYGLCEDVLSGTASNFDEGTKQQDDTEEKEETLKENNKNSLKRRTSVSPSIWMEEMRETTAKLSKTLDVLQEVQEELSRLREKLDRFDGFKLPGKVIQNNQQNIQKPNTERQLYFEQMAQTVERWASNLLFNEGGEEDGWKEVSCNKLFRGRYNPRGDTKVYLKWLPDSRPTVETSSQSTRKKEEDHACMKCYATLNAPLEHVCEYLADGEEVVNYNSLLVKFYDLEDVSDHSKVVWGQSPQILFIKPRDFVTFCSYRWKKGLNGNGDDTQVVVNQAVDHKNAPPVVEKEGGGKVCRAFAYQGANFLSKDPSDPNKTKMSIITHANPAGGIPPWACKTAVNAVANIEPFKLFHNIEVGSQKRAADARVSPNSSSLGSNRDKNGSRPSGLSQMGYACFWPNGNRSASLPGPVPTPAAMKPTRQEEHTQPPIIERRAEKQEEYVQGNDSDERIIQTIPMVPAE